MSSAHNFTEIPLIDLTLANDPLTRPSLLKKLRHALISVGFLYISGHDVPEEIIDDLIRILPVLFALPESAKERFALLNSPHFLGYSSVGTETTGGNADTREQVEFATELTTIDSDGAPLYEILRGPNQWPSELPNLRLIVTSYIHELTALGERFLRLVADALFLPEETFSPFLSDQHRLKLVRYPGVPGTVSPESAVQGVGPHKDSSGWWTFLLQASPPTVKGLQALNKDGDWIDVPVIKGTFVVNIGQAFEVVTGGVCKATTHRVIMSGNHDRYSVPFFQGVRRSLTKSEAVHTLQAHFRDLTQSSESVEGAGIDSAFLKGNYDTWGESQLRTKIRSHRDVGRKFYPELFDRYINDE